MKNKRSGFTLVEVVVSMAIVIIITAVTMSVISLTGKTSKKSENVVRASNEARSVVDCYVACDKNADGLPTEASLISKLGLFYNTAMTGKYTVADTETGSGKTYTLFYDAGFGLMDAPGNIRAGGYAFRLEITFYPTSTNEKLSVRVIQYAAKAGNEKTLYDY